MPTTFSPNVEVKHRPNSATSLNIPEKESEIEECFRILAAEIAHLQTVHVELLSIGSNVEEIFADVLSTPPPPTSNVVVKEANETMPNDALPIARESPLGSRIEGLTRDICEIRREHEATLGQFRSFLQRCKL